VSPMVSSTSRAAATASAPAALVDVIVATATAIEFAEGRFFGNAYRRTNRCHRVLLGNNKQ
jgi:hypothetical protein